MTTNITITKNYTYSKTSQFQVVLSWVVTPRSDVVGHKLFEEPYIVIAMKTSNLARHQCS